MFMYTDLSSKVNRCRRYLTFSKIPTITHWIYVCPVIAVAHALTANVRDYYGIMGACILQGVFFGITNSHTPALMYEAAGHARYPQAMSLVNLMYGFGNVFSNIIGGKAQNVVCFH
ncbi:hypothetical protein DPMN_173346 [Dreissena polymorpha]|uniref:Uncharacterized protein n=1 Tax=Dreissena polymorpha TaxID=45954 RepID=A0A9D4E3X8_DREPO|nr:hypothetical protein DPMN_173346 [Dreissena polymorpha]